VITIVNRQNVYQAFVRRRVKYADDSIRAKGYVAALAYDNVLADTR
jgi:hypothetical protein